MRQNIGNRNVPKSNVLARYKFWVNFNPVFHPEFNQEFYDRRMSEASQFLIATATEVVEKDFRLEVSQEFGGLAEIRLEKIQKGSIFGELAIVLATGVTIYQLLAQYDDFFNSLVRLRNQLRNLLFSRLNVNASQLRTRFSVSTVIDEAPLITTTLNEKMRAEHVVSPPPVYSKAFFWYLLIANIVLIAFIGLLIYPAIVKVYFSSP